MSLVRSVTQAVSGLVLYVWAAAFVWSLLPDGNYWWTVPAMITTTLLGMGVWFGLLFAAEIFKPRSTGDSQ